MMQIMVIQLNDKQLRTLEQLQAFLDGTAPVDFTLAPDERYAFISRTLRRFGYGRLISSRLHRISQQNQLDANSTCAGFAATSCSGIPSDPRADPLPTP